jgi:hypothetical protein
MSEFERAVGEVLDKVPENEDALRSSLDGEMAEERQQVPLDVAFDMLKNERRRHVLRYLLQNGGTTSLSDLAESLAAIENGKPKKLITSQERKRVYVGLYQCHLPKMDDAEVISFDRNRGTVELDTNAVDLYRYLHDSHETPGDWDGYYLSVAGLGVVILVGSYLVGYLNQFTAVLTSMIVISGVALGVLLQRRQNYSEDLLGKVDLAKDQ